MNIKELRELAEKISPTHSAVITEVVEVLSTLRTIDLDEIDRLLVMQDLSMPTLPKLLHPALQFMKCDLTLVKAFAEQARAYNYTKEGLAVFDSILGEEVIK